MIRRLLYTLSGYLPLRVIAEKGAPYLERYYVGSLPFTSTRVYLHRFVDSDPDRGCHDHPWKWALSLVLAGYYIEERQEIERGVVRITYAGPIYVRTVRWFNWLRGTDFHRVVKPRGTRDVWSLFIHHPHNVKNWGFARGTTFEPFVYRNRRDWWVDAPAGRDVPERAPL